MKLIDECRSWHKLWSIRLAALAGVISGIWPLVPDNLREALPAPVSSAFAMLAFVSIIIARLIPQEKTDA